MGESDDRPSAETRARRDGAIDFSRYSTEQLLELRDSIDEHVFPLNFAALLAELDGRSASGSAPPGWSGRWTTRDGLAGWVQAKARWQSLYGPASMDVREADVVLQGRERTWLGMPIERALCWPTGRIRNVAAIQNRVRFELRRDWWLPRKAEIELGSPAIAASLARALPQTRTRRFERLGLPLLQFEEDLRASRAWLTPVLVLLNLLMFGIAWAGAGRLSLLQQSPVQLWAMNIGPLTLEGQWWRPLSALFVHGSIAHLLLNMWALWHIGRLTERLFGSGRLLCIYLGCGLLASLGTLAWDPGRTSLGASGAIFGLFGSFLALLFMSGRWIPRGVFRAHWIPTLLFTAYNLIAGIFDPVVDNAAHTGGLLSGLIMGAVLSRASVSARDISSGWQRMAAATIPVAVLAIAAMLYLDAARGQVPVAQRFLSTHQWFVNAESRNLVAWERLAASAAVGAISDEELGTRFQQEILPFWEDAHPRLGGQVAGLTGEDREYASAIFRYVEVRRDWARAIVAAMKGRNTELLGIAQKKSEENTAAIAAVQRLAARSVAAQRSGGLTNSSLVKKVRGLLVRNQPGCIRGPVSYAIPVSDSDSRSDGPAMGDAAACEAQRLFLSEEYERLNETLSRQSGNLDDLPGGGSSLLASIAGLRDLVGQGSGTVEGYLASLAAWRHAVPDSPFPDIVEVLLYNEWAWNARGHGFANQISQQAWAQFQFRNELAWSALQNMQQNGRDNPLFCYYTLLLEHDRSAGLEQMRSSFDRCIQRFPRDAGFSRTMLRALMPRWGGSLEKVADFIKEMSRLDQPPGRPELYARLYWVYADLEQDQVEIFKAALAEWQVMQAGFEKLLERHPGSDVILNGYARFACEAGDGETYWRLKPEVLRRMSATAWSRKTTVADCDRKLAASRLDT